LTPEKIAAAAKLARSGQTVSMAIPINKQAGPRDVPDSVRSGIATYAAL
jgi:hypothetical protein